MMRPVLACKWVGDWPWRRRRGGRADGRGGDAAGERMDVEEGENAGKVVVKVNEELFPMEKADVRAEDEGAGSAKAAAVGAKADAGAAEATPSLDGVAFFALDGGREDWYGA